MHVLKLTFILVRAAAATLFAGTPKRSGSRDGDRLAVQFTSPFAICLERGVPAGADGYPPIILGDAFAVRRIYNGSA